MVHSSIAEHKTLTALIAYLGFLLELFDLCGCLRLDLLGHRRQGLLCLLGRRRRLVLGIGFQNVTICQIRRELSAKLQRNFSETSAKLQRNLERIRWRF